MAPESKNKNEPFLFPTGAVAERTENPSEITWRCDYLACIERGGIMSMHGVQCQSEDFRNCFYYQSHQKTNRGKANAGRQT